MDIKKGDKVLVVAGDDRGAQGEVQRVMRGQWGKGRNAGTASSMPTGSWSPASTWLRSTSAERVTSIPSSVSSSVRPRFTCRMWP